jgi:arylsulfatase A-like enzyme
MFMSDNGGSGNGGNAPLKGSKSTMWEGGLRVPFLAWWPGKLPASRVTDDFLTALELFPTIAGVAGARVPGNLKLDGFDMLPVLRGDQPSPRAEMFWQRRGDKAARLGHWKWSEGGRAGGLYDLAADLGETKDLSKEKPEVLAKLKARWDAWREEMNASEPRGPFRDY